MIRCVWLIGWKLCGRDLWKCFKRIRPIPWMICGTPKFRNIVWWVLAGAIRISISISVEHLSGIMFSKDLRYIILGLQLLTANETKCLRFGCLDFLADSTNRAKSAVIWTVDFIWKAERYIFRWSCRKVQSNQVRSWQHVPHPIRLDSCCLYTLRFFGLWRKFPPQFCHWESAENRTTGRCHPGSAEISFPFLHRNVVVRTGTLCPHTSPKVSPGFI